MTLDYYDSSRNRRPVEDELFGTPEQIREHVLKVVDAVRGVVPAPGSTPEEAAELEKMKERFLTYLIHCGDMARSYLSTMSNLERAAARREDAEDYMVQLKFQQRMEEADRARRLAHNAFMDHIDITRRMARWFFDKNFDPEMIPNEQVQDRVTALQYNRVVLPPNIFSPKAPELSQERREEYSFLAKSLDLAFRNTDHFLDKIEEVIGKQ